MLIHLKSLDKLVCMKISINAGTILIYLIQMSSPQTVVLFLMLELEWLKGFLQCPPPNLCAFLKVVGVLSHETPAYFSCPAVVLCSTERYCLLS